MISTPETPISFASEKEFTNWLKANYTLTEGIWLRYYKKSTGIPSITYAQALDVALCYGWIDGQAKPFDGDSWLQRFTPRRAKSNWSKRNTEHVARLIETKKMRKPGLLEIEKAKADGRWAKAYDSFSQATIPDDVMAMIKKNEQAHDFYKTLNKTNLYAIAYRIQTAVKPETREKRIKLILEMLSVGKKFHG